MKKKEMIIAGLISVILLGAFSYFFIKKNKNFEEATNVMKETNKVMDYIKNTKEYKEEYKIMYEQINYHDINSFFHEINLLLSLNYTPNEII